MASTTAWAIWTNQRRFCDQIRLRNLSYPHRFRKNDNGQFTSSICVDQVIQRFQIVPQASAIVPGAVDAEAIAIPANHQNMVKFASRENEGYRKISGHLRLLAEEAPVAIRQRWREDDSVKKGTGSVER